jgi:phage baseplate assembly protein W
MSSNYILTDLNIRLTEVNTDDIIVLNDSLAAKQELVKLFGTQRGSIKYYRAYGLDLRKYLQYPMTQTIAFIIYDDIKNQINNFVKTVTIMEDLSTINLDWINKEVSITMTVRVNKTGNLITLPPVVIPML